MIRSSFAISKPHQESNYRDLCHSKKDSEKIKAVQTSYSTARFMNQYDFNKKKSCSKSQEDNTLNKETVAQDEIHEWWDMYKDREKMKKLDEKLQRLAEMLKRPGGEEKIRTKIEKYMKRVPSYFSDCDEDCKEFRDNLPNAIVKKLKKHLLGVTKIRNSNLETLRVETPKYLNIRNTNHHKSIIKKWLNKLTMKNKDYFDNSVLKDDIIDFIICKIEPLFLGKPDFDVEFRYILKSNLIDVINEIPISINNNDKKDFLNRLTDNLIEDLLKNNINQVKNVGVNCEFGNVLKPTTKDVIDFVADHLDCFQKICCIDITPKRIICLERKLVNIFMDTINSVTVDINKDKVNTAMECTGKLIENHAKYLTKTFTDKINDLLWKARKKNGNEYELLNFLTNSCHSYSSLTLNNNKKEVIDFNTAKLAFKNINLSDCSENLIGVIEEWLKEKQILLYGENKFKRTIVKDLAKNIIEKNVTSENRTKIIEYEVIKWIKKLFGSNLVQHINIQDLVEKLIVVTESALKCRLSFICQNMEFVPGPSANHNMSYVEELTDIMFEWYHEQPFDMSIAAGFDSHSIKETAENIYKRIVYKGKPNDVIENEINEWIKNFLNYQPGENIITDLKNRIKNVNVRHKHKDIEVIDKDLLQRYKDSVSDWLDRLTKDPFRRDVYTNSKNMFVEELAERLYEIKKSQGNSSNDVIAKRMKIEVSDWLVKVPIHRKLNIKNRRDVMANILVPEIQETDKPIDSELKYKMEFDESLMECDINDWLRNNPLYTKQNAENKQKQETYTKELANVLNQIKDGLSLNLNEELANYVKKLDIKKEYDNNYIKEIIIDLKTFLQNIRLIEEDDDKSFRGIIMQWLQSLPLNITSEEEKNIIECLVKALLELIQQVSHESIDEQSVLESIRKIMKALPIECKMKCNEKFLIHYSKSLLEQINKKSETKLKRVGIVQDENLKLKSLSKNLIDTEDKKENNDKGQLIEKINDWLTNLKLLERKQKGLRAVVMNELAEDIVARQKFLEMSPSCRGTDVEETDHLKFQIFKSINELVGEKNLTTIEHADELMERIRPILEPDTNKVGNQNKLDNTGQSPVAGSSSYKKPIIFEGNQISILGQHERSKDVIEVLNKNLENRRFSNTIDNTQYTNKIFGVTNVSTIEPSVNGESIMESLKKDEENNRLSGPSGCQEDCIPKSESTSFNTPVGNNQNYVLDVSQQTNIKNDSSHTFSRPSDYISDGQFEPIQLSPDTKVEQIYEHYDEIFKQRADAISLEVSSPEEQTVVNGIRQGIVNIIWNCYFKLKCSPEYENDYKFVEIFVGETLDEVLEDLLPRPTIQDIEGAWKINVLNDVVDMLKKVHNVTDTSAFKILVNENKGDRLKAIAINRADTLPEYSRFEENLPFSSSMIQMKPNVILPTTNAPVKQYPEMGINETAISNSESLVVQPHQRLMTSIRDQQSSYIVHNQPGAVGPVLTSPNRITTNLPSRSSNIRIPASPRQMLDTHHLDNLQYPCQRLENQQSPIQLGSPRHGFGTQASSGIAASVPRPPVVMNPAHSHTRPDVGLISPVHTGHRESQVGQLQTPILPFLPGTRPISTREGIEKEGYRRGEGNIIEEMVSEGTDCTCEDNCTCRERGGFICYCYEDDDEEDVFYVPCKYYY